MNIKKQTVRMYLYETALSFRMTDAVWVIFLLERGFTLAQVGIAEGVYHITSMIFEVPSGMAADLFGRKRTLLLSGIVGILSSVFMTLDGWAGFVYCSMIFSALSMNLASGTEEALVYDSLLEADSVENYKKFSANMSLIGRTASALACAASPVAIMIGNKYTYYIGAFLYLCAVLAVTGVREPIVTKRQEERGGRESGKSDKSQRQLRIQNKSEDEREKCSERQRVQNKNEDRKSGRYPKWQRAQNKCGRGALGIGKGRQVTRELGKRLKQHILETGSFIKNHPRTMLKLLADAALACPCYLIMMYLQEHLVNCGWPKSYIGIPMLFIPLVGALGAAIAVKNKARLPKALFICGIISGIGTCLVGSSALLIVICGACIVRICEGFSEIVVSENVNRDFTSDHRATLVSVDSMCYSILMVAASPATGYIGERYSVTATFYLLGGGLLAAVLVLGVISHFMQRR